MPSAFYPSRLRLAFLLAGLLAVTCPLAARADAQSSSTDASSLPAWERLTPQQRDLLIAPMRERWNNEPAARTRMLEHAQRWQDMTPDERRQARSGMKRWRHMSPEQREQMRALYARMRTLPPPQRAALKAQWRTMTPEQRQEWVESNPPPRRDRPER